MTPAAPLRAPPARPSVAASRRTRASFAAAATLLCSLPVSARAETAFSASLASDDRFRGDSVSGERPVGTLSIGYDDVRGPYAGASFTLVATRHDGLQPLRSIQYLGYAKRLESGLSLDVGVTSRLYSHYFTGEYGRTFAEGYVGLIGRRASTHIFYSPDYDGHGGDSVYAEVEALLIDRGPWSLSAHGGLLSPPKEEDQARRSVEADWRLGLTRRFDHASVSLQWVGATPKHDSDQWRGTILLSASRSF